MGYTTKFDGLLTFKNELTIPQLKKLKTILGEDAREHSEWSSKVSYIDLEINDVLTGLQHDGAEKTYDMEDIVTLVISEMKKDFPDFDLDGELMAQGEDVTDRWRLIIQDSKGVKVPIVLTGEKIKCPNCGHHFLIN